MYTTKEILEILHEVGIKSANSNYFTNQNILFFAWADVPKEMRCPINEHCTYDTNDIMHPCKQCPITNAVTKCIIAFKKQVEDTVKGIQLSNEIDWFRQVDTENATTGKKYVFESEHQVDVKRVIFILVPIEFYKEKNQGQLLKISGRYQRIKLN